MRLPGLLAVLVGLAAAGCALIAGLHDYTGADVVDGAPPPGDAGVDVEPDVARADDPCVRGLQAGSPWPARGGCAHRSGRSRFKGPDGFVSGQATARWVFRWDASVGGGYDPVIDKDGFVYYGTEIDGTGLIAVDRNGGLRWTAPIGDVYQPAIAADGTLYVAANSAAPLFYAIRPDGSIMWQITWDFDDALPMIDDDGTIYAQTRAGGHLDALYPDGGVKWHHQVGSQQEPPIITIGGQIVFAADDGTVRAIGRDGGTIWTVPLAGASTIAQGDDGTLYATSQDGLSALDPQTGVARWTFPYGAVLSAPAIDDGHKRVYVGAADGNLLAIHFGGKLAWTVDPNAAFALGPPVVDTVGLIYVGDNNCCVYAYDTNGVQRWRYNLGSGSPNQPAIGNDQTIYAAGYDESLHAIGR